MSKMFSPPNWHPTAVATERGWIVPETGELLVACKDLCTRIAEFKAGKITEDEPVKEIEDAPAETNESEQKQDDLADAEKSEGEPTESAEPVTEEVKEAVQQEAPKKRGPKPKVK